MFVFYDTETTGTNKTFDQILQFAAILTDEQLNPIEQINLRCRIQPWVVPSPGALLVTGITPETLIDPALPSFYEMMMKIRSKLDAWSPAIFTGYNTMRFDEPFLQQALWQTLNPPYLTVTNGNSRMDVIALAQAAVGLVPDVLDVPSKADGKQTFRLDQLAPANGFAHANAHDALADVEATIHLARLIRDRVPELWKCSAGRSPKSNTLNLLSQGEPVLVVEHYGGPILWWGQRIDDEGPTARQVSMADLSHDWNDIRDLSDEDLLKWGKVSPRPLRGLMTNKAPVLFSVSEADEFWSLRPTDQVLENAAILDEDSEWRTRLAQAYKRSEPEWPKPVHLEELIHEGFANNADKARMEEFHRSAWSRRFEIMHEFQDDRFRRLAHRLIYLEAPELLGAKDVDAVTNQIAGRLHDEHAETSLWRSIRQAKEEMTALKNKLAGTALESSLEQYLSTLASDFPATGPRSVG